MVQSDFLKFLYKVQCTNYEAFTFKKFDIFINEVGEILKKKGDSEESVLYLKRLCKRSIYNGAKIRKNDGLDYSIITCLAKENVVNETNSTIDLNNTFSLTFDTNLYRFSKENSVLYKKQIYDELLNKTIQFEENRTIS